jgi:hypothetical protein
VTGRDAGGAVSAGPVRREDEAPPAGRTAGRLVLAAASLTLLAVSVPVLVRGAPLADDFHNCLAPQDRGLAGFFGDSFERLGLIRPARFVEILVTTGTCQHLHFGVAIGVNLALTLVVALLLRRLLASLGAASPWPEVGAALWLLQPLGTEVALWPAALHVPLGLAAALGCLLAVRRGRLWAAVLLGLAAMLSVEQVILALPLAAWLVAPPDRRRSAAAATGAAAGAVLAAYLLVPGNDPRLAAGAGDRLEGLVGDLGFLVRYPAAAAGAESVPLAVWWAFPVSAALLALGAAAGWWWAARGWPEARQARPLRLRPVLAVVLLLLLLNAPVLASRPPQGSPRVFAPTWLLLAALAALWLGRGAWRHRRLLGAAGGLYLAGAALSLALSAWVRVETATVVERVSDRLAAQTRDGETVLLCDVPRAAVSPAPRGAFAVQDYLYEWAAADALRYYTGRRATVRVVQAPTACPASRAVRVLRYSDLAEPR